MAGRRPNPARVKEFAGNPGKRALPKTTPCEVTRVPKRPLYRRELNFFGCA